MTYVVDPPTEMTIPVTKNCDRAFTLQRVDTDNDPVNFGAGVTVYMYVDIDPADPEKVDAVIDGSQAAFTLESELCDQIKHRTRWRIVLDQGSLETPLLVGRFVRRDG